MTELENPSAPQEKPVISPEEVSAIEREQKEIVLDAEAEIEEVERNYNKVSKTFEMLENNVKDIPGEEGVVLREEVSSLREKTTWSAEWWVGQILSFTNVVVGEIAMFPSLPKEDIPTNPNKSFEETIERAKRELLENGITREQARTYKPIVHDLLETGVEPFRYKIERQVLEFLPNLLKGKSDTNGRDDAWRMYLGVPQKYGTFEISNYLPPDNFTDVYCYKIKDFWTLEKKYWEEHESASLRNLIEKAVHHNGTFTRQDDTQGIMREHTLSVGRDENGYFISYHTVWELSLPLEKEKGFFGKPFTLYDRLYFNHETFEPIE